MKGSVVTEGILTEFKEYLLAAERSRATVEKYLRDVKAFANYAGGRTVTRETVIGYKKHLQDRYAVRSVNSMLASVNSLFTFLGWQELKVKYVRLQQPIYCPEEKELTRAEYIRLCRTAERKRNARLCFMLQTICGTGIRVSELPFITVEAVRRGEVSVCCKGKTRSVFLVKELQKKIAPLCSRARNQKRDDFYYEDRQAHKPHQHLAGDEGAVQGSGGKSPKGLSP